MNNDFNDLLIRLNKETKYCCTCTEYQHGRRRMLLASAVVVWEWLNEHGRWRPYSPAVSHHIEAVIRNDPRGGSVVLGQVDSRLSPYIIDLHSMHQFRQDTGKTNVTDDH
uniref:Deltex 4, E3 ubiquitin ligase a n=1 Tax=Oncorhynchus mykiss TaxID=8022 RepID=A0A8K9Y129_ONCMY